jgi:hypothetical protein
MNRGRPCLNASTSTSGTTSAALASSKTGKNIDCSLENAKNWAGMKASEAERNAAAGGVAEEEYNSKAFADMTDLSNEDFVCSL